MSSAGYLLTPELHDALSASIGAGVTRNSLRPIAGGSISRALRLAGTDGRQWFVKLNEGGLAETFAAEADGLQALAACPALRVPAVCGYGVAGAQAYLVLAYLDLRPLREHAATAGTALAELHRMSAPNFGWRRDNFIGSSPQANTVSTDWPHFFARRRLQPQLERAERQGYAGRLLADGERLVDALAVLFADELPRPSLLHGDLWSGNVASDAAGRLVLFDPAVYFGDREADLAMSELFGGFPAAFYAAYRAAWPLAAGYAVRKTLYNLYHVLNHLNLFGRGYLAQAEAMIGQLLAEIKR